MGYKIRRKCREPRARFHRIIEEEMNTVYTITCLHFHEICVTGYTRSCQIDSQWRKFMSKLLHFVVYIGFEYVFLVTVELSARDDDVIKWKHFPRYWHFVRGIHRSPANSPYKGQWRGALMISLICAWINGWANNREAGDLSRHRAHYDVTAMVVDYEDFIIHDFNDCSSGTRATVLWLPQH